MDRVNKKTIIYIGGFELPDKNAAAHRVLSNAKGFRDSGYEVIFVGISKTNKYINEVYEVQGFKCYNVKYPVGSSEWIDHLTSIENIKFIINKEKVNFIVAYNYPALPLFKLLKFAKKNSIKIFADVTEWNEAKGNIIFKILKTLDVNFRMRYVQNRLDGLIVISDFLQNYYENNKVKNILNIPPLVDVTEQKWKNVILEKNDSFVYKFIYSGSPGNGNKDRLDLVVESLKTYYFKYKIPIIFEIIGISKQDYISTFNYNKELSEDYNFVKFHGRISHITSIEILKTGDFSIFFREKNLTNSAGFPTKLAESISAGTPVITNVSSSIANYFTHNKFVGFLLEDLDVKEIDEVFSKVFAIDKKKLQHYKEKCHESKLFDYRNFNGKLKSLIENSNN